MDNHEQAMREAARDRCYWEEPIDLGRALDLIREQVRRMDERCKSKWSNGDFMLTEHGGPVPVSALYCPVCGKRIEVVEDGK